MKDRKNCDNCNKQLGIKVYYALGKYFCSTKCGLEFDKK